MSRASAIYQGSVTHVRLRSGVSKAHAFAYRLYMLYLDLDELPSLLAAPGPLRSGRFGLLSFARKDYLAGAPSLAESARDRVERELGFRPAGPVRLLTHVRSLGYAFNPVSFYYCFAADGTTLEAVVAEITNTPWNERHAYVLRAEKGGAAVTFEKSFHVSPFFPMEQRYRWAVGEPGEALRVEMVNEEGGEEVFRARLDLARRPLGAAALWRAALLSPLMAWKVHAAIYWQALRLWAKGTPFHAHPRKRAAAAAEELSMSKSTSATASARPALADAALPWRRLVLSRLAPLAEGMLSIRDASGEAAVGRPAPDGLSARIEVRQPRFWRRVALGGSLAAAEAYADGDWEAEDLTAVVRVLARNADALDAVEGGLARLRRPFDAFAHFLRRNTRDGSRRNIAEHYDLGNDFFALMLDPTMTYSCGIFESADSTLEEASLAKIDRLCRLLRLRPGDHLLEIGTGWAAFALHAARRYGCRVTTTTISRAQHELARERVAQAGLDGRVTVLLEDYRDLRGRYDKLVSVEMLEAVGAERYREFFGRCSALLEPDGLAAIQVITIADQRYEQARRGVDFVKRWVFPGSNIPSVTALLDAATSGSDLRLRHLEEIGPHYARTLASWRENLVRNREAVERITTPRFRRLWHYYLCYCEAGFAEGYNGDVQMLFARPRAGG